MATGFRLFSNEELGYPSNKLLQIQLGQKGSPAEVSSYSYEGRYVDIIFSSEPTSKALEYLRSHGRLEPLETVDL